MKTLGIAINNDKGELIQIKTTTKQGLGVLTVTGAVSEDILNSVKNVLQSLQVPRKLDIHIDIRAGRLPLCGPSLGYAILKSIIGAINNESDDLNTVFTGIINNSGNIEPVGGLTIKHETAKKYNKVLQTKL